MLELQTGKVIAGPVLNTGEGSISIENALAAGEWLVLYDDRHRTLVYSLGTGKEVGRAFGTPLAVSDGSDLLCLQNVPGKLEL